MNDRAAELRRAFDESFAAPPRAQAEELEDVLALRIRGDAYGLRVREIAGVARADRIQPLPSRVPELLGVAGLRGSLVPVYSLAGLLGYADGHDPLAVRRRENPRWLALVGGRDPLALALSEFEGYVRLGRDCFYAPDREPGKHVDRFARAGETVRAIIQVASIVAALTNQAGNRPPAADR
jgi:purine-binding chemotaxis protein CheW